MAFETNKHVERLGQYLPFDPSHPQIYEESTDVDEAPKLEPRALAFATALLQDVKTRVIVFTGDAGHGKTHLCRRLIQTLGIPAADALEQMNAKPRGDHVFVGDAPYRLRVVKDLSDLDVALGAEVLLKALAPSFDGGNEKVLICANEGRLRNVIAQSPELQPIREVLDAGVRRGVTQLDGAVHVINLNFQSVTSPGGSLLIGLMKDWAQNERRWSACKKCDAAELCPILANRRELKGAGGGATNDPLAESRRDGLQTLLRVVEESGRVITIRELLILAAYMLTGGLNCAAVHDRVVRKPTDRNWQAAYAFHELLFEPPLSADQRRVLPVLQQLHKLDPGLNASRVVDEPLAAGALTKTAAFYPTAEVAPDVGIRTKKVAREEAERVRKQMRFLRRRDYFDMQTASDGADLVRARTARLALKHYADFEFLRSPNASDENPKKFVQLRDRLLAGLHAVQGIHYTGGGVHFYVVDPAFSRASGTASVVARQINGSRIRVRPESEAWNHLATKANRPRPELPSALDWLDRKLMLFFDSDEPGLELDLVQFEYVMRSGDGLGCRRFFRADIRRILAQLAKLIRMGSENDDIKVLVGTKLQNVTIDHGGLIRTGEG